MNMEHSNETVAAAHTVPPVPFSVTEAALKRITYLLSDEPPGTKFFVCVQGGGCSGFQYHFELAARAAEPGDLVIQNMVVVDEVSLPMLANSTLDYEEDLSSAGFVVKNPNATARCGCGNSFAV